MKISRPHTLASRLTIYVLGFTLLSFTVVWMVSYNFSRQLVIEKYVEQTHTILSRMATQIGNEVGKVEQQAINSEWIIKDMILTPDSLYEIVKANVKMNPLVSRVSIAFEPNYYKAKGRYFMISAVKRPHSDSTYIQTFGSQDYDYPCFEWYFVSKNLKKDCWSEPHIDQELEDNLIATFSHPLMDEQGNVFAVIASDLSLERFSDSVLVLRPYADSHSFMLSRSGSYMTKNPVTGQVVTETIFSDAANTNDEVKMNVGHEMVAGRSGMKLMKEDGKRHLAFYTSIPHSGWSICTVCSEGVILRDLYKITWNSIVIFAVCAILMVVCVYYIIYHLTRPLHDFSKIARSVATGRFDIALPELKHKDEIMDLRNSLAYMQTSLGQYIHQLKVTTSAKQRIESELSIAHDIQMTMIPKDFPPFPERNDIDIYAILRPAKLVGGDLYDFMIINEELYFIIGDVSGKGVPASLFMAIARSLFRTWAQQINSPAQIMTNLNMSVAENNESAMFITMIIGIIDLKTGRMRLCNAGHNPPVQMKPGQTPRYFELKTQMAVGIDTDTEYVEEVVNLEPRDRLFFYTDGLNEAESLQNEQFGEEKVIEKLTQYRDLAAKPLVDSMVEVVLQHTVGAQQSDDLTMMVIDYKANDSNCFVMEKELILKNDLKEVGQLGVFIDQLGEELSLPMETTMNINLAIEEAVSNVIMYAYPPEEEYFIRLHVTSTDKQIIFLLTDKGRSFDPTKVPDADINLDIDDRPIGGLGIYLVRCIMNEVSYQRLDDENRLTMKKDI